MKNQSYNLKTPFLSSLTLSFLIHFLIITALFFIAKNSSIYKAPSAYIVNIVNIADSGVKEIPSRDTQGISKAGKEESVSTKPITIPQKLQKDIRKGDDIVKERIDAIKAKKHIEKIVALRKMIDIGRTDSETKGIKSEASVKGMVSGGHNTGSDYYTVVINKIRQNWIFPESIDKDLLAIITIRIAKDGSITIGKIEKSSGNPLFDRSAMRAIASANPLPAPPQEIEIGVRFMP